MCPERPQGKYASGIDCPKMSEFVKSQLLRDPLMHAGIGTPNLVQPTR